MASICSLRGKSVELERTLLLGRPHTAVQGLFVRMAGLMAALRVLVVTVVLIPVKLVLRWHESIVLTLLHPIPGGNSRWSAIERHVLCPGGSDS